jgi:alpha-acetolactate decarboxylase
MVAKVRTAGVTLVVVAIAASVALALAPSPPVRTFGTIRQLVDLHDDASKVVLADVVSLPGTYGLGSLSQLRGEVTILDGVTWISYRPVLPGESPRVVSGPDIGEEAGFLVTANVAPERWRQVKIDVPFSSETLEPLLQKLVAANGLGGVDLPFRIDGRFETLTLAIIDGRKLPRGPLSPDQMNKANYLQTEKGVEATFVGFMAAQSDGRFTHPGTRVHVHAVVPSRRATGHAQTFAAAAGATLWLPTAPYGQP